MKGQVAVRPFFRPQYFLKKITWLESALNSEQNHVFFFLKKKKFFFSKKFLPWYPLGTKKKKFFFLPSI
jgi:hypothetical protein